MLFLHYLILPSSKLIFLRSSLGGRALSLVENLVTSDASYHDALKLLDDEFLDREFIFNEISNKIITSDPLTSLDKPMIF